MSPAVPSDSARLKLVYERDADLYCRSLPLERFMESTTQSTQRKITVESLDLVSAVWPEFQVFSELLIQYPLPGKDPEQPARVVPDNMVFVHPEPIEAEGSFMVPMQSARSTLVLDYVSTASERKDYEDNRQKYERDLKVPYYLIFHPEKEDLILLRLTKGKYLAVKPNTDGRLAIPELELEVTIQEGWTRFWFRGRLLPLPGDLLQELNSEREDRIMAENAAARASFEAKKAAAKAESERAVGLPPNKRQRLLSKRQLKNAQPVSHSKPNWPACAKKWQNQTLLRPG
jgi:hypothetical protein